MMPEQLSRRSDPPRSNQDASSAVFAVPGAPGAGASLSPALSRSLSDLQLERTCFFLTCKKRILNLAADTATDHLNQPDVIELLKRHRDRYENHTSELKGLVASLDLVEADLRDLVPVEFGGNAPH